MTDTMEWDLESKGRVDLIQAGLDRYSADLETAVMTASYSLNKGPWQHWQAHRDGPFPYEARQALMDPLVEKWAFNAQFERVMTNRVLKIPSPIRGWRCTMVLAHLQAFAGGLEEIGKNVGLPLDKQKLAVGKQLINTFCKPQKITKNQPHEWRDWNSDPDLWALWPEYNTGDCITERAVRNRLLQFDVPEWEWELYAIDQSINDRGFPVDLQYVRNAIKMAALRKQELTAQMRGYTGLDNPGSRNQLLPWLQARGYPFADLQKDTISKVLAVHDLRVKEGKDSVLSDDCAAVMRLRQWQARLSVSKYDRIVGSIGKNDKLRYLFQFSGAARTRRWAGRIVQTQNLVRTPKALEDRPEYAEKGQWILLSTVTDLIRDDDYEMLCLTMEEPMEALIGCLRGSFRAPPSQQFTVADLSSIETAVIAWLTGCKRLLRVFRDGLDPYKDFATEFYQVTYDAVTKWMRGICKPPMLGCGYRLGGGEMYDGKRSGLWGYAENMGVDMEKSEAHRAVKVFREKYPEIPAAWKTIEGCVRHTMQTGLPSTWGYVRFERKRPYLIAHLPSGGKLFYFQPKMQRETVGTGRMIKRIATKAEDFFLHGAHIGEEYEVEETYERIGFSYMGKHQKTGQWVRIPSHGGRFIEQFTQGLARDVFGVGMIRAHKKRYRICAHSHDELVVPTRIGDNEFTLAGLIECMKEPIDWAPGLPLGAAGYQNSFYLKD